MSIKSNGFSEERTYKNCLMPEEENKVLRATLEYLKKEVEKFKKPPLLVCEIKEILNDKKVIVKLPNNNHFVVDVLEDLNNNLEVGDTVLAEQRSLTIVDKVKKLKKFNVTSFVIVEKPKISWDDLGGLNDQIREIKEVIELPLMKPELFKKIGIEPPKGILLYGSPGTGKTLLAKAVAASTNSTFIEIVGSELVQKFIGEGAKLVKDIFNLAREKAPSIVFIDEIDAIAASRVDVGTGGEREVQRTFMQLLSEIDGFKNLDNVKIIGATNREDILDPAILRPGRLDRLIEIPIPNSETRKEIFNIYTKNMKISKFNVCKIVNKTGGFSGADIKAVCMEAGYFAIRRSKSNVTMSDFYKAIDKIKNEDYEDEVNMFG